MCVVSPGREKKRSETSATIREREKEKKLDRNPPQWTRRLECAVLCCALYYFVWVGGGSFPHPRDGIGWVGV